MQGNMKGNMNENMRENKERVINRRKSKIQMRERRRQTDS